MIGTGKHIQLKDLEYLTQGIKTIIFSKHVFFLTRVCLIIKVVLQISSKGTREVNVRSMLFQPSTRCCYCATLFLSLAIAIACVKDMPLNSEAKEPAMLKM